MFTLRLEEDLSTEKLEADVFVHFVHNFRELPTDKIARINAILAEPPAPKRKTRSDAGRPKSPVNQPELPVTPTTTK